MVDRPRRPDLLPSHATPRERATADTDGRLDDLAAETAFVTALKSPDTVPADPPVYMQALAWERSVDVWDDDWPEDIKRAAIAVAPEVHRYKGTVRAVKAVLGAFQVDAEITEWWQTAPQAAPYTFHVQAFARARLYDGPILDARLVAAVYTGILRAKPLSRAFSFSVAVAMPARLGLAPVAVALPRVAVVALPADPSETFSTALGLAPVACARARVALVMTGTAPDV